MIYFVGVLLLVLDICPVHTLPNKDEFWTRQDLQTRQHSSPDIAAKISRFSPTNRNIDDPHQPVQFTQDEKEEIFLSFAAEHSEKEMGDRVNKKEFIEKIQEEFELPITGKIDDAMIDLALTPRCGTSRNFNPDKSKWQKKHLKYSFDSFSPDLSECQTRNVLRKSFRIWEEATDLTFEEVSDNDKRADIKIGFRYGKHLVGRYMESFKTKGKPALAHAWYPTRGILHFNEMYQWTPDGKPVVVTYNGNTDGSACVFPFTYDGLSHDQCITMDDGLDWCATTNNFDKDGKWGLCPHPKLYTLGGNSDGQPCVFPFRAYNKEYNDCTDRYSVDHEIQKGFMWCATTSSYDNDKKWGYCPHRKNVHREKREKPYSMLYTAVHEIGHVLGWDHTNRSDSMMVGSIRKNVEVKLSKEDSEEAKQWYGERTSALPDLRQDKCGGRIAGVLPPVTPPKKPITLCDVSSIDAALSTNEDHYFFKNSMLWRVQKEDTSFKNVEAFTITDYFEGGPVSVDAAFMASNGSIVLFKDNSYWRYYDEILEEGPGSVTELGLSGFIKAVVPISSKSIYIYYGKQYIQYYLNTKRQDRFTTRYNYKYPDGALRVDQDYIELFKDQKAYKMNSKTLRFEERLGLTSYFHC